MSRLLNLDELLQRLEGASKHYDTVIHFDWENPVKARNGLAEYINITYVSPSGEKRPLKFRAMHESVGSDIVRKPAPGSELKYEAAPTLSIKKYVRGVVYKDDKITVKSCPTDDADMSKLYKLMSLFDDICADEVERKQEEKFLGTGRQAKIKLQTDRYIPATVQYYSENGQNAGKALGNPIAKLKIQFDRKTRAITTPFYKQAEKGSKPIRVPDLTCDTINDHVGYRHMVNIGAHLKALCSSKAGIGPQIVVDQALVSDKLVVETSYSIDELLG